MQTNSCPLGHGQIHANSLQEMGYDNLVNAIDMNLLRRIFLQSFQDEKFGFNFGLFVKIP